MQIPTYSTMEKIKHATLDRLRMLVWLVLGLALYAASLLIGPEQPVIQTVLYKVGHVTTLAWVGYWIARQALGRIDHRGYSTDREKLARAVVIAGVIIAGSLGL